MLVTSLKRPLQAPPSGADRGVETSSQLPAAAAVASSPRTRAPTFSATASKLRRHDIIARLEGAVIAQAAQHSLPFKRSPTRRRSFGLG